MSNSLAFATPQFWRERAWAAGIHLLLSLLIAALAARKHFWTVLLDRSSAQVLGYIALDPY